MSRRAQQRPDARGVLLIEALVALLIVAFAIVALGAVQAQFLRSADLARQRGDALRLAQQDLETLRGYTRLEGPGSYASIGADSRQITPAQSGFNADFVFKREVESLDGDAAKAVRVTVTWQDRAGETQQVRLDALIHRADPALAFALSQPPDLQLHTAAGRNAAIPPSARDLGDGRSAYRPAGVPNQAWIFDNGTGVITSRCNLASPTRDSELIECVNVANGYLLSGTVRFSMDAPPSSDKPASAALPLSIQIVLTSKGHLLTPAFECGTNEPSTHKRVDYDCLVSGNTAAPPIWSGYADLAGLAFTGPHPVQSCRYSADYDGDGFIGNAEHPEQYIGVHASLRNQNFLVIAADQTCPAGHGIDPARGWFTNTATVLHQSAARPSHGS